MREIIEDITIKYRHNFREGQNPKKIFSVAMGTSAKAEILKDMKKSMQLIEKIVEIINTWPQEKVDKEFKKRGLEEKKEKKKKQMVLPKMENVIKGKVVTCFPPEPSKYPHIGHAYAGYVNYKFAKENEGKFILRFEDTNPNLAKEEYYDAIKEIYKWFGIDADKYEIATNYMPELYKYAKELIEQENAYICSCSSEITRENRQKKKECSCRANNVDTNLKMWQDMLEGKYSQGEVSLRLKGFMDSLQAEFRDPILMRINTKEHTKTKNKYIVWPAYILQNTVLDNLNGVTHRFRSKEFEPWKPVQKFIAKKLNLNYPQIFEYARVNITGTQSQGRKIRDMVESGAIEWDNPALTTLHALRRRGFLPESIIEFIEKAGVSKTESNFEWSVLESINRKLLSQRDTPKISAFKDPIKVEIENKSGYIDNSLEDGKEYRIKHFGNVIKKGNKLEITGKDPKPGLTIISFAKEIEKCTFLMPRLEENEDNIYIDKEAYKNLKKGDIVLLQGIGFCKLDCKKNKRFIFGHI